MNKFWDRIGICASGLCLVHCIATPFLLLLFPSIKLAYFEHDNFHQIFGVIVVSSVLVAVYPQCRKHGHKDIVIWALSGVLLILAGIFIGHELGEHYEHILTILGSFFLIWAHVKNMKVRHGKCETKCEPSAESKHSHSHSHSSASHDQPHC